MWIIGRAHPRPTAGLCAAIIGVRGSTDRPSGRSTGRVICTLWCSALHPNGDLSQPSCKTNKSNRPDIAHAVQAVRQKVIDHHSGAACAEAAAAARVNDPHQGAGWWHQQLADRVVRTQQCSNPLRAHDLHARFARRQGIRRRRGQQLELIACRASCHHHARRQDGTRRRTHFGSHPRHL